MSNQVVVIDYGIGNLLNVVRAFEHIGASVKVASTADVIEGADRLVLPGVGAFRNGVNELKTQGLSNAIINYAQSGRPLLGICLGMQMLLDTSEEFGVSEGLGLIPGNVQAIPSIGSDGSSHKIPHIGWNEMEAPGGKTDWQGTLFDGIEPESAVYFVHSYKAIPIDVTNRLANCDYNGVKICAAIQKDNIMGCQFHPEKSGEVGLDILGNFLRI